MIVLYNEFKIPAVGRIFICLFLVVGLIMVLSGKVLGLVLGILMILMFLVFWGLFIKATFDPDVCVLEFATRLFGLDLYKTREQIEVNHIAMTRIFLKTKESYGVNRGAAGGAIRYNSTNYQYSLQLIFNGTRRELIESYADEEEMKKKAIEIAAKLKVKLFDATGTPQKWIDPVTGEEKIAEFKKRKR